MAFQQSNYITPDDYLEIEIREIERREYFEGRIYDMAGASFDHNYIVSSLTTEIGFFLKDRNCDIFVADLRITTPGI